MSSNCSYTRSKFYLFIFIWNSALVQRENETCKNSGRNITKRRTSQDTEVTLTRRLNNKNTGKYLTQLQILRIKNTTNQKGVQINFQ